MFVIPKIILEGEKNTEALIVYKIDWSVPVWLDVDGTLCAKTKRTKKKRRK